MLGDRIYKLIVVGFVLGAVAPTRAVVPGGGPAKSDCYAEWSGVTATSKTKVVCKDGDPVCDADGQKDGKCTFGVGVCLFQSDVAGCTPQPVTSAPTIKSKPPGTTITPPPFAGVAVCGDQTPIVLPLRTNKKGQAPSKPLKLKMKTVTSGKPKSDIDKLTLQCLPGTDVCADNPAGGPKQLLTEVPKNGVGSDLDNGFNGISHNFPVTGSTKFNLCLTSCDAAGSTPCTAEGATGAGTINGPTFGAPLPLLVAGVAVCVVNRYNPTTGKITGTADLLTGDLATDIDLLSDVYILTQDHVCPRCTGSDIGDTGKCDSGLNVGQACVVDGSVTVAQASGNQDKNYKLSTKCLPTPGNKVATLTIPLRLRTGTRTRTTVDGVCPGQLSENVCGGTCNAACTGNACLSMGTDPVSGNPICLDAKGGLSQLCCSDDPTTPCHPKLSDGGISRTGKPAIPQPAAPADTTYPKSSDEVLVDVFCEAATGVGTIDNITSGLPGPGALVYPIKGTYSK